MSASPTRLESGALAIGDPSPLEPERVLSMTWPAGPALRRAGAVALAGGLALPLAAERPSPAGIAIFVVMVGVGTLTARLIFEALAALRSNALRPVAALIAVMPAATGVQLVDRVVGSAAPVTTIIAGTLIPAGVLMLGAWLRDRELRRQAARRRVFFIGSVDQVDAFAREVGHSRNLSLVGSEWLDGDRRHPLDRETLLSRVAEVNANTVVLSERALADRALADAAATKLNVKGLRVRSLAAFYEEEFGKVATSELSSSWFLFDVAEIHGLAYRAAKRLLETLVALGLLVLSAPLWPVIALAIKRSSPGPVLFRGQRIAMDGRVVTLVKFRTMEEDSERKPGWADASRMRVFPVGRFLRKFRFDEIPQLWNVVRGQLSIVGPRPEQPSIVAALEGTIPFYAKRHSVRPGLTGWAQVNFGYGGSQTGSLTKLQYDLYYVKHQSLRLDWQILLTTLRTVIGGTGR